jgi:nucleotide-binding universal stress UspA family protein
MFERILVPLDGSKRAEVILAQTRRFLKRDDAELLLLRAVDTFLPTYGRYDVRKYLSDEREEAERYIQEQVLRLASQGHAKVHGRVVEGFPAEAILAAAKEEGSTLLAMSTHGRSGLARWAMGSVAERIVRSSDVPVFLARSFKPGPRAPFWEPAPDEDQPVRKILVPTDGSEAAASAVGPAEKLAQLFGAEVVVLHVVAPPLTAGPLLSGMDGSWLPPALFVLPPSEADEATRGMAERFAHAGLNVSRFTVMGDPAAEILDHPSILGVDLIAMATHGRSGASRWVVGSVAERVLRHTQVPLLLIRAGIPAPSHPEATLVASSDPRG